MRSEISKI